MSEERLSTDLLVSSTIRMASCQGVSIMVYRKGHARSGTLVLKINLLNGFARILVQTRRGDERVWTPATATDPMPEAEADAYLRHQADIDPDVWLIEIEDKQDRLWFPGKVVNLEDF